MPTKKKPSAGKSTKSGKPSADPSSVSKVKTGRKQKFGFGVKPSERPTDASAPASPVPLGTVVDEGHDMDEPDGSVHYPEELRKLSAKEQTFVLEYMKCKNATKAAELAGYQGNANVLGVTGNRMLRKDKIAVAVEAMMKPVLVQARVSVDRLVEELSKYAFGKLEDFVKIQYDMAGNVVGAKLVLKDKLTAIKLLGDHLGMFKNSEPLDNERPSLHLHFHPNMSAEEARQRLLNYLRQRQ